MGPDRYSEELQRLRTQKNAWFRIAQVVNEALQANGWKQGSPSAKRWLVEAAECAGIELNTLNRMLALQKYVLELGPAVAERDRLPFATLEILKRIDAMDPELAIKLLPAVISGEATMRMLRLRLEELIAATPRDQKSIRSQAKRDAVEFERVAAQCIDENLGKFGCGTGHLLVAFHPGMLSPRPPYFQVDLIAYDPANSANGAVGFLVYSVRPDVSAFKDIAPRLFHRGCYLSNYFQRFYLVLPNADDQSSLNQLAQAFQDVGKRNIGVVSLDTFNLQSSTPDSSLPPSLMWLSPSDLPPANPDLRSLISWTICD